MPPSIAALLLQSRPLLAAPKPASALAATMRALGAPRAGPAAAATARERLLARSPPPRQPPPLGDICTHQHRHIILASAPCRAPSAAAARGTGRRPFAAAAAAAAAAAGNTTTTAAQPAAAAAGDEAAAASWPHVPVLLDEVLAAFDFPPAASCSSPFRPRTYVDGTLGAAGHASAVLRLHGPRALRLLVGIDVDLTAHALAGPRLEEEAAAVAAEAAAEAEAAAVAGGAVGDAPAPPPPPSRPPRTTIRLLRGNHSDVAQLLSGVPWPEAELGPHPSSFGGGGSNSSSGNKSSSSGGNKSSSGSSSLFGGVDAMLLDLGVSSMQIDDPGRGFSFVRDGPLDMRMGRPEEANKAGGEGATAGWREGAAPSSSSSSASAASAAPSSASSPGQEEAARSASTLTAADIVNTWSEAALAELIRDYGEEKMWRRVAARIVRAREERGPLLTTSQLVAAIGRTALRRPSSGGARGSKSSSSDIHPATRTFQALRIAVNDELGGLARAIPAAIAALAPGGRLAVISFHSLEDRVVKHAMLRAAGKATPGDELEMARALGASGSFGGGASEAWRLGREAAAVGRVLTRRPVLPGEREVALNPRARSAKLRVFEKFGPGGAAGGGGREGEQEAGGEEGHGGRAGGAVTAAAAAGGARNKKATHRSKKWRLLQEEEQGAGGRGGGGARGDVSKSESEA